MSQATVGRIIKSIPKKIALLLPHFIKFPYNSELAEVKRKFYQLAGFPRVIGAIDCTHVRIKCPAKNVGQEMAGHFLNRKGFYSLNIQIVCDADCKIIDIVARSRGSKHDARIWGECQLKNKLELSKRQHNGVLLGDGGYPLSPILLTPGSKSLYTQRRKVQ
ncbi:putative nuclease HARBI1 [Calliphora vicina]|uniref:putative nuclease HARBI1 n=1 Tax=Calliphora vicina TaxID=7373 RepID=UPI00325BD854